MVIDQAIRRTQFDSTAMFRPKGMAMFKCMPIAMRLATDTSAGTVTDAQRSRELSDHFLLLEGRPQRVTPTRSSSITQPQKEIT